MRRRRPWILAVGLVLVGLAACGDDGGSRATASSTTAPATTPSTVAIDTAAEVDAFCTTTDELKALLAGMEARGTDQPPTSEEQARIQAVGGQATQKMMTLQGYLPRMLPGDAARFQECSAVFGG
ncbi:MAG TPA: hypothetical protein VGO60_03935 [Iamia sp.]|jgi:hypothetical protein|nr:hypothetical protein [Iamia sp.]